jgi:hypothetical protein
MVLTGMQAYKKLKEAFEIIEEVSKANVVDCDDDYLLLISSRSNLIKITANDLRETYDEVRARAKEKSDAKVLQVMDGTR